MSAATAAGDRRRISIGLPAGNDEGPKSPDLMVLEDGTVTDPATGEVLEDYADALVLAQRKARAGHWSALALAEGLAGERLTLGHDEARETVLLGADGRELAAEAGEGLHFRAAALLLLESQTPWAAVGKAEAGRIFGVGGSGYTPGLRFSPAYQRKQSARSRKVARAATKLIRRRLGAVAYSTARKDGGKVLPVALTLTSPTLDPTVVTGITESREEERLYMAWALLRKRDVFKDHVFAGLRGFEMVRNVDDDGVITYHPHFHELAWSKYLDQLVLATEWWDCLRIATKSIYGFDLQDLYPGQAKDQKGRKPLDRAVSACVYIQAVRKRVREVGSVRDDLGHREGPTSLESAIQETLKYQNKPDEVARYSWDPETGEQRLEGLPGEHLREEVWRRSPRLFEGIGAARKRWKLPAWCKVAEGVSMDLLTELTGEAAREAARAASEAARCSLDTPPISDGEEEKKKRETLRSLMHTLDLHRWLQIASRRAFSSLEHLEKGLQAKGFWVPALAGGPPG